MRSSATCDGIMSTSRKTARTCGAICAPTRRARALPQRSFGQPLVMPRAVADQEHGGAGRASATRICITPHGGRQRNKSAALSASRPAAIARKRRKASSSAQRHVPDRAGARVFRNVVPQFHLLAAYFSRFLAPITDCRRHHRLSWRTDSWRSLPPSAPPIVCLVNGD
jgi:hypothetical protein